MAGSAKVDVEQQAEESFKRYHAPVRKAVACRASDTAPGAATRITSHCVATGGSRRGVRSFKPYKFGRRCDMVE
jgi:hypothetical protein